MNRRDFIKKTGAVGALGTWTVTCQYEEKARDPKGEKGEVGETGCLWDYRVYCYERGQGQWVFSKNTSDSFAPEREYMTFEQEQETVYHGFMDGGKLHFPSLEAAENFIDSHIRDRDDTEVIDSIYDVYHVIRSENDTDDSPQLVAGAYRFKPTKEVEIHIAHHWYNENGRQIQWQTKPPYSDFNKIESA